MRQLRQVPRDVLAYWLPDLAEFTHAGSPAHPSRTGWCGTLDDMGCLSPGTPGDPHGEVFEVAGGKAVLSLRPDGILHLVWSPGTQVQEEDAVSAVTMMNPISPNHDRPLLVDMRNAGNTSSRARDVFANPHPVSRVALLGESPVDRVIASFFTGVHRPQRPTRYFTSEAEALSWLSGG